MKKATIKDVAAEAGVAISTVSLALSGKGYVSQSTRRRVRDAANRLQYVPARAAQRLASNRTGNIGFVLREDHFTRSEPFYTRVFLGTEFEAHQHGFYVLLTTIPNDFDGDQHLPRFLRESNVDGVLVAGKVDPGFLSVLTSMRLPAVLVDFEFDGYPSVQIDNQAGVEKAVAHLVERSHRRIAFLGADPGHPSISGRLDGFKLALSDAGIGDGQAPVLVSSEGEPNSETGRSLTKRLFDLEPLPTAVVCANDALALAVLRGAAKRGIRIPDDLAVIGFDDVEGAAYSTPALTTVRVYKEQLGELASRYLAELIAGESDEPPSYDRSNHAIRVPAELVVRDST